VGQNYNEECRAGLLNGSVHRAVVMLLVHKPIQHKATGPVLNEAQQLSRSVAKIAIFVIFWIISKVALRTAMVLFEGLLWCRETKPVCIPICDQDEIWRGREDWCFILFC